MKRKTLLIICAVVILLLSTIRMYAKGVFYIEEKTVSPDGKTTTIVYNVDVTEFPFDKNAFTIKDKGYIKGSSTYKNAKFHDLWWSPDSKYRILSLDYEKEGRYYALDDFIHNVECNLIVYLGDALYNKTELKDIIPYDKNNNRFIVEYNFKEWTDNSGEMVFDFNFIGRDNLEYKGSFIYNHTNQTISDVQINTK